MQSVTCAEQQQDLHAQVLVVGDLQPDKLVADLQHLLALVGHEGQLHSLSEEGGEKGGGLDLKLHQSSSPSSPSVKQPRGELESGIVKSVPLESEVQMVTLDGCNPRPA